MKKTKISCALLIIYIGAYYLTLAFTSKLLMFTGAWEEGPVLLPLGIQIKSPALRVLFQPIYLIDRQIRPEYWTYEFSLNGAADSVNSVDFMKELDDPDKTNEKENHSRH